MAPGDRRPWHIDHTIPIGNEHGEVRVTRDIPNRLTPCKQLVFSVESGKAEVAHIPVTLTICASRPPMLAPVRVVLARKCVSTITARDIT